MFRAKEADDSHYHKHGLGVASGDTDEYSSYLSADARRLSHEYSTLGKPSFDNQSRNVKLYVSIWSLSHVAQVLYFSE